MRTTVDLDPGLQDRLKLEATRRRLSFKSLLNSVIRGGLAVTSPRSHVPYTLPSFPMGATRTDIDLDKALHLADDLEAREVGRELGRQK